MENLIMFIKAQSGVLHLMTPYDAVLVLDTYTIMPITKFKGLELLKGVRLTVSSIPFELE